MWPNGLKHACVLWYVILQSNVWETGAHGYLVFCIGTYRIATPFVSIYPPIEHKLGMINNICFSLNNAYYIYETADMFKVTLYR